MIQEALKRGWEFNAHGNMPGTILTNYAYDAEAERQVIQLALIESNGTIAVAAKLLGISRPTLYTLLEEHGIAAPVRGADGQRSSNFSESRL